MKKVIFLIIALLLSNLTIKASIVDEKAAFKLANNYYAFILNKTKCVTGFKPNLSLYKVITQLTCDLPAIYVYNNDESGGFIIISADTHLPPVLGYSFENTFDEINIPPALSGIISRWVGTVSDMQNKQYPPKYEQQWQMFMKDDYLIEINRDNILPMLKTQWGQGEYYNSACPVLEGQNTLVGCVATAVSQIMKYWNFPLYGSGRAEFMIENETFSADMGHTLYDWNNMPNSLSGPNNAVATLCYHVGAALQTIYGTYQSGASGTIANEILPEYFNYNNDAKITNAFYQWLTIDSMKSIIYNDLHYGFPVLVSGNNLSNQGHAYVCDGFQDGLFHFNFGWDGYYDGFYNIENEIEYNQYLCTVTNIHPKANGLLVSNKYPMLHETVDLRIFSEIGDPQWIIYPQTGVTIENDNSKPDLFHLVFSKYGSFKILLFELNGYDTIFLDESNISIAFSLLKRLRNSGLVACGQSLPCRWFDFDNDGDLDLYQSFFTESVIYRNNNGNIEIFKTMPSAYNGSTQVFDYDNDSYLDIVQTILTSQGMNVNIYKNINGVDFIKKVVPLPNLGGGSIIPSDFNNDNAIDLLIYGTDYYNDTIGPPMLKIVINRGNHFDQVFELTLSDDYRSENLIACDDFDNDGDVDIFVRDVSNYSTSIEKVKFIRNDGNNYTTSDMLLDGKVLTSCDMDKNGSIDILSISDAIILGPPVGWSSKLVVGLNSYGEFDFSNFELEDRPFGYDRTGVLDLDSDGNTDVFITRTNNENRVSLNLILNKDTANYIQDIMGQGIGPDAHCGDFNNDGYSDVVVGGAILINAHGMNTKSINTPPSQPTNLKCEETFNNIKFSWNSAIDVETPIPGLSYNLMIGSSKGGVEIMSPMSDPLTGKRKIIGMGNVYQNTFYEVRGLPPGKYYWSVQAIDNGYIGGDFAILDSVEVHAIPADAGEITGLQVVCQGDDSILYRVPEIQNAETYEWILPENVAGSSVTNSIIVKFGTTAQSGVISVRGKNQGNYGTASQLEINVKLKPPKPKIIEDNLILFSDAENGNEWYNQDGIILSANSQSYQVISNGYYYTIVTIDGCSSDTSNKVFITTYGLDENSANRIKVYPNPFRDKIIIESILNGRKNAYKLFSLQGDLIYQGVFSDKSIIHLVNLKPGVYYLLVLEADNYTFYYKMVKY